MAWWEGSDFKVTSGIWNVGIWTIEPKYGRRSQPRMKNTVTKLISFSFCKKIRISEE